ncbi:MAG: undecaprenyldiphospho-muramoylpentapeptide beta-N-acetylglucosaminyltransferase [Sediminibacterium sp.]|nr:undecaprenyldiphospho-muramoylpentapeptide beta-N-acetylglucosaminyltransferase [Sediminibacterium sp.]MBX9780122.1 undecaprenyldiphospho-muramoylpentapeptide beta-N-acetylglucosaminyltransferase [Chitinophagaceae bacterium]
MSKKFIIAGGGTGGHIFPAIAIANALKEQLPDAAFLFIGAKGKMEMEKVPQAGYAIEGLDIAGFNRTHMLKNIGLPLKLIKSFVQVRTIFKKFKPDAVIGVGGYSSFPVLRFAQSQKIPTFLHESNSFAGKANIMLGKKATAVFVATKGMESFFPNINLIITGNPVRKSIVKKSISKEDAILFFGLAPDKITVLVVGGSLGAKSINDAILQGIQNMVKKDIQLIWQTGKTNATKYSDAEEAYPGVVVTEFIKEMETGYAAADIIVSRAGAMAVTELCIIAKPVILVPFPHAAEDHQTANALQLVNADAAILVKDADANNELVDAILLLAEDKEKQIQMTNAIKKLAITDADTIIAKKIIDYIS